MSWFSDLLLSPSSNIYASQLRGHPVSMFGMLCTQGKASAGALTGDVQQNDTGTGARTGRIFDPRGLLDKTPQELLRLMTYWKLSRPTVGAH